MPGGLPGAPSMAARTRLPEERPREVLRRVASFLGVLPCADPPANPALYSSTFNSKSGPASELVEGGGGLGGDKTRDEWGGHDGVTSHLRTLWATPTGPPPGGRQGSPRGEAEEGRGRPPPGWGAHKRTALSKQMSVRVRSTSTMGVSWISAPSCSRQKTAQRCSSAGMGCQGGGGVKRSPPPPRAPRLRTRPPHPHSPPLFLKYSVSFHISGMRRSGKAGGSGRRGGLSIPPPRNRGETPPPQPPPP